MKDESKGCVLFILHPSSFILSTTLPAASQSRGVAAVDGNGDAGDVVAALAGEPDGRARHIGRLGPSTQRRSAPARVREGPGSAPGPFPSARCQTSRAGSR